MTTGPTSSPGRRAARLPGPARRAVRALEHVYGSGTTADYDRALAHLRAVAGTLDEGAREQLNVALAAAHERIAARRELAALAAALAGPWETVRRLPGDVELVRLVAGGPDMLATVPALDAADAPHVIERVSAARDALRRGRCPRCGAGLAAGVEGQATLRHAARCPLGEARLARARVGAVRA